MSPGPWARSSCTLTISPRESFVRWSFVASPTPSPWNNFRFKGSGPWRLSSGPTLTSSSWSSTCRWRVASSEFSNPQMRHENTTLMILFLFLRPGSVAECVVLLKKMSSTDYAVLGKLGKMTLTQIDWMRQLWFLMFEPATKRSKSQAYGQPVKEFSMENFSLSNDVMDLLRRLCVLIFDPVKAR